MKLWNLVGMPDRVFLGPGRFVMFAEFKGPGGRVTSMQKMWLERLTRWGFTANVVRSLETFERELP